MSLTQRLTLLPLLGIVACTTASTEPNEDFAEARGTSTSQPDHPKQPPKKRHKVVFVTSALYQGGALGGLDGADAACGELAEAAGLTGTFKAWLSSGTTSAADRLAHSTHPYTLVDGTRIADDWADLIDGVLRHPINVDETGTPLTAPADPMSQGKVWTDTVSNGQPYTDIFQDQFPGHYHCDDWTDLDGIGVVGDPRFATDLWSYGGLALSCASTAALYCFEQ